MKQNFKNIYFADLAEANSPKSSVTLAFGARDGSVYERVRVMSSSELRSLVGYQSFAALKQSADNAGRSVNAHCLYRIKRRVVSNGDQTAEVEPSTNVSFREAHLQATFRGGVHEPLHAWYPYLEGYSPQFVEDVLKEFMPDARRILDPFSGTGTTPLTAAKLGRQVFYCELNPLLQALTEAKRMALTLEDGKPEARFVEIAALSSLVPASRLIRRGDLRFKTPKELAKPTAGFDATWCDYLRRIARDLQRADRLPLQPVLVCEDARKLANIPHLSVDSVITSPPYLNGTNYFRNTKVELWFLRALHDESDLSAFRAKTVTAIKSSQRSLNSQNLSRRECERTLWHLIWKSPTNAPLARASSSMQCCADAVRGTAPRCRKSCWCLIMRLAATGARERTRSSKGRQFGKTNGIALRVNFPISEVASQNVTGVTVCIRCVLIKGR